MFKMYNYEVKKREREKEYMTRKKDRNNSNQSTFVPL